MLPSELSIKSKMGKMFVYKVNPYSYKNYEKKYIYIKIMCDKNGRDYIAFRIDIFLMNII